MKSKRKRHAPEFKAKVALEAVKALQTAQQLAKTYDITPVQISEWKKTLVDSASSVFGPQGKTAAIDNFEREREQLHAKIGQLSMELEFMKKKSKQLGL